MLLHNLYDSLSQNYQALLLFVKKHGKDAAIIIILIAASHYTAPSNNNIIRLVDSYPLLSEGIPAPHPSLLPQSEEAPPKNRDWQDRYDWAI